MKPHKITHRGIVAYAIGLALFLLFIIGQCHGQNLYLPGYEDPKFHWKQVAMCD